MIKQLLEEVRDSPLDEAGRARLAAVHERSMHELEDGLSPELVAELRRISLPFDEDATPSDAELRIAQAQLVGWLEGLFHGIQTALVAQQMAAQAQIAQMRRALPGGPGAHAAHPGQPRPARSAGAARRTAAGPRTGAPARAPASTSAHPGATSRRHPYSAEVEPLTGIVRRQRARDGGCADWRRQLMGILRHVIFPGLRLVVWSVIALALCVLAFGGGGGGGESDPGAPLQPTADLSESTLAVAPGDITSSIKVTGTVTADPVADRQGHRDRHGQQGAREGRCRGEARHQAVRRAGAARADRGEGRRRHPTAPSPVPRRSLAPRPSRSPPPPPGRWLASRSFSTRRSALAPTSPPSRPARSR